MTIWDTILNFLVNTGLKLLLAVAVLIAGWYFIKFIVFLMKKSKLIKKADATVRTFLSSFVTVTLKTVLIISVIGILGFPLTGIITVLGTAGIAIGLAFQGALSNLAGGLMILFTKPFRVGDYIDNGAQEGTVESITVFYTKLTTSDNKLITVPNKQMTEKPVINFYAKDKRRVDLNYKFAQNADIEKIKQLLTDAAAEHPLALEIPQPFARLISQANNVLEFSLRVWVNVGDYWTVFYDLTENIKKILSKEGL
ncbi:MAG: mechanosensitive ion channel family protein [Clostridia bacterium]|nr:mechanosensitive ion channel family protein [Clostridia bacterium]